MNQMNQTNKFTAMNWAKKALRLRYIGHIINLAIQDINFADDAEAAEIAYAHVELSSLDNRLDIESLVELELTGSGLVEQSTLQKLNALAVASWNDRSWQAFKTIANCFTNYLDTG